MMKTKDFIYIALFTVFAVVLSIIENFIPLSFSIPGLRIGLANIAVLAVLYLYSFKYGLFIIIIKNILVFLQFGNITRLASRRQGNRRIAAQCKLLFLILDSVFVEPPLGAIRTHLQVKPSGVSKSRLFAISGATCVSALHIGQHVV